jgi:hypothetical protein
MATDNDYSQEKGTQKMAETTEGDTALAAKWYVAVGHEKRGPLTADGVRLLGESGAISDSSLGWTRGMTDWTPLSNIPELANLVAPALPGGPAAQAKQIASLTAQFAKSGAERLRASVEQAARDPEANQKSTVLLVLKWWGGLAAVGLLSSCLGHWAGEIGTFLCWVLAGLPVLVGSLLQLAGLLDLLGALVRRFHGIVAVPMILREFRAAEDASGRIEVEIAGREQGLVAWCLSLLGFPSDIRFFVCSESRNVRLLRNGSMVIPILQSDNTTIPLQRIASAKFSVEKPARWLYLGVGGLLISGIQLGFSIPMLLNDKIPHLQVPVLLEGGPGLGAGVLGLLWAALFFYLYRQGVLLSVLIETTGGSGCGVRFKRSIVQDCPVGAEEVSRALDLINQAVLQELSTFKPNTSE